VPGIYTRRGRVRIGGQETEWGKSQQSETQSPCRNIHESGTIWPITLRQEKRDWKKSHWFNIVDEKTEKEGSPGPVYASYWAKEKSRDMGKKKGVAGYIWKKKKRHS